MEKINMRRLIAGTALIAAGSLALSACATGQANPPSIEEIRQDGEYFELTRPDGSEMTCWQYGARGDEGYAGYAWFGVDCDWSGAYQAPEATTTTTQPESTLPTINTVG
jgi:hypothetical protein